MSPTFEDGDFALCRVAVSAQKLKKNDMIVLQKPSQKMMVKRIVGGDYQSGFEIQGDNIRSAPRIDLGRVRPDQICAKVILKIGKSGSGFV